MRYQQPYGIADPNAPYVNGDPSIGRAGSIPPAAAFEEPMREIVAAINGAGITPSGGTDGAAGGDLAQLWKAMQIAPWVEEYAADTGTANAYIVTLNPAPPHLYPGMTVRMLVANSNTGASTLNVNGLGAHAIKRATGAVLNSGDLAAGELAFLIFDGSNWQIANFLGFTSDTTINNFTIKIPYALDSGTTNNIVGLFSPAITTQAAGDPVIVKVGHTCTGAVTLKANAMPAVALQWPDGTPLVAGDIVAGGIILAIFDGTEYQLMCRINGGSSAPPAPGPAVGVTGTLDIWPLETPPMSGTTPLAYECNGQALSTTTDAKLYAVLGNRYGNAGAGTFKVPDLRGQFIRGWSHSTGADPDANTRTDRGDGTGGDHVGTKQGDQVRSHGHPGSFGSGQATSPDGYPVVVGNYQPVVTVGPGGPVSVPQGETQPYLNVSTSVSIAAFGGNENRPGNVNMMYIIWR